MVASAFPHQGIPSITNKNDWKGKQEKFVVKIYCIFSGMKDETEASLLVSNYLFLYIYTQISDFTKGTGQLINKNSF